MNSPRQRERGSVSSVSSWENPRVLAGDKSSGDFVFYGGSFRVAALRRREIDRANQRTLRCQLWLMLNYQHQGVDVGLHAPLGASPAGVKATGGERSANDKMQVRGIKDICATIADRAIYGSQKVSRPCVRSLKKKKKEETRNEQRWTHSLVVQSLSFRRSRLYRENFHFGKVKS